MRVKKCTLVKAIPGSGTEFGSEKLLIKPYYIIFYVKFMRISACETRNLKYFKMPFSVYNFLSRSNKSAA